MKGLPQPDSLSEPQATPCGIPVVITVDAAGACGALALIDAVRSGQPGPAIVAMDMCPGLPPELPHHLYARLAMTRQGSATGTVPSISRCIVEAHGGTLATENGPLGGAATRSTLSALEELVE